MSALSTSANSASAPLPRLRQGRSHAFLAAVADDYEQALRDTDKIRQDMRGWKRSSTSTASRSGR
jgi:hypothetical protein